MRDDGGQRARRWRLLRGGAAVLLACQLLYLLAGNAFLNSGLARDAVNRKPEKFRMAWTGGYTLWPGHVALRGVRMQGHVRRTLWSVEAERARGRIALLPLLGRQIRIPRVHADGVAGSVAEAETELPRPEPSPGGWTLRMDRIATDSLRGGSVRDWRIAGDGRAEVGFSKQFRGGPMELFASSAEFRDARVAHGDTEWLRDARLAARFSLPRHVAAEHPGIDKLALFMAALEVEGATVGLRAALDEDGRYAFDVVPGDGRVDARLSLERGALAPGDRLHVRVPLAAADAGGAEVDSHLDLRVDVDDSLRLRARLPGGDDQPLALDADLAMPGNALPLQDWRSRLADASGTVRGRGHLPSIGGIVAMFAQADWLALEGSGRIEADLTLADGRLVEGSRMQARDVVARADVLGNRFSGRARADAAIVADADGDPRSRLDVVMEAFSAAPGAAPSRPYVTGSDLRVEVVSDARFERMRESMRARVRFDRARIPDLSVFNAYLPNDRLRLAGGSGVLSGDLRLDGDGDVGTGSLRVDGRQVRMAVAGIDLRGDVAIDGRLRRGNLQRGDFELGGTRAEVHNVSFTEPGGEARSGWWATVEVDGGHVAWRRPSSAGGTLRARMKDVAFLLAMFADRSALPGWIGRVIDDGEATLQGRWEWRDRGLVLDRMHAANDRFKVDARLDLQERRRRGDLHVGWGVLGVGVELQDEERKYHLRRSREWYEGRPDLLD